MVHPQRGRPRGLGAVMIIVVAALISACASANQAPSHQKPGTVASRPVSPHGCSRNTAYQSTLNFELSIAPGVTGSPSPRQAAVSFAKHGGVPGFRASTSWVSKRDAQGVTLHDATTFLHVVQVATGGWVVDSGGHCG